MHDDRFPRVAIKKSAVLFATSGGHFTEMLQWSRDLDFHLFYIVDGPNVSASTSVLGIEKIDGIIDALWAVPSLLRCEQVRRANFFISGGSQNALAAWCLSLILRRDFYYVESFQRTNNLSRAGWFSLCVARKVFVFHEIAPSQPGRCARIYSFFRHKVVLMTPKFVEEE